jgi:hypothetical protein
MKILIAGDSFAADWSIRYHNTIGWPNLLASKYYVHNVAQAGVSEYKILKQIESVTISDFDAIIISHTSFSRVHTRNHPFLLNDTLHKNCDLILSDIAQKKDLNQSAAAGYNYFKYHFDEFYYKDIYNLIRDKIEFLIRDINIYLSINNFQPRSCDISYKYLLKSHKGDINHFNHEGNEIILKDVLSYLWS